MIIESCQCSEATAILSGIITIRHEFCQGPLDFRLLFQIINESLIAIPAVKVSATLFFLLSGKGGGGVGGGVGGEGRGTESVLDQVEDVNHGQNPFTHHHIRIQRVR